MSVPVPPLPTSSPSPTPAAPRGSTLLLVEDDPNDILLIQRAFRKAQVTTWLEVAHDGDEAIAYLTACRDAALDEMADSGMVDDTVQAAQAAQAAGAGRAGDGEANETPLASAPPLQAHSMPLAVLLDLKLPRRSGLEVLAWVRQQPVLKWLPVIVLTSSREQVDLRGAYDLGANSYLIKPVGFDALLDMMRMVHRYWVTLNEHPAAANR